MTLRAYAVRDIHDSDGATVLVIAESVSRAKRLAKQSEWLDYAEWLDLRCKRAHGADKYSTGAERLIDGNSVADQRIMRELGWHEIDGSHAVCGRCDLYEWADLPESIIGWIDDEAVCAGCAAKGATGNYPIILDSSATCKQSLPVRPDAARIALTPARRVGYNLNSEGSDMTRNSRKQWLPWRHVTNVPDLRRTGAATVCAERPA